MSIKLAETEGGCWRTFLKVPRTLDNSTKEPTQGLKRRGQTDDVLFREMSECGDRWDVKNKAYLGAKSYPPKKMCFFSLPRGLASLTVR